MARIDASASKETVKKNRWVSLAWIAGIATVIIACLVSQQTALLYVLSTLGVTILLVIVARADLSASNTKDAAVL